MTAKKDDAQKLPTSEEVSSGEYVHPPASMLGPDPQIPTPISPAEPAKKAS